MLLSKHAVDDEENQMSRLPNIFSVPMANMEWLQKQINRMNKKAIKLGTGGVELIVVGSTYEEHANGEVAVFQQVAIEGEEPKVPGWRFVARIDHNTDPTGASNIVYSMPGRELPAEYRSLASDCSHCNWTRKRRDTFILEEEATGELRQVGRTCIKDFLGEGDPERFAKYAEWLCRVITKCQEAVDREPDRTGMHDHRFIILDRYLAHVSKQIEKNGWVSGRAAREDDMLVPTREQALKDMFPYGMDEKPGDLEDRHYQEAQAAIAWAQQQDPTKNDFTHNMVTTANTGYIDFKMAGTAAAIVYCYQRETAPKTSTDLSKSRHVFAVGERVTVRVQVLSKRDVESYYGPSKLVRMLDTSGNLLVTFASGKFNPDVNSTIEIAGSVKRHDVFNGVNQTILNRVKEA